MGPTILWISPQVRDVLERTLTGSSSLTFRTEPGEMGGSVDPQFAPFRQPGRRHHIYDPEPDQHSAHAHEFRGPFLVNGEVVETVPVPATLVRARQQHGLRGFGCRHQPARAGPGQSRRRGGSHGRPHVRRPYTPRWRRRSSGGISIPLRVILTGSLTGPATVTEVLLDVPPDGKTVDWGAELRAHGLIKGTGNGPVSGIWLVDEQPIESFQVNMLAGHDPGSVHTARTADPEPWGAQGPVEDHSAHPVGIERNDLHSELLGFRGAESEPDRAQEVVVPAGYRAAWLALDAHAGRGGIRDRIREQPIGAGADSGRRGEQGVPAEPGLDGRRWSHAARSPC